MQQLLTGRTHLPGFGGEWESKKIRDIAKIPVTDGPHLTPKFLSQGIPFLSVNNLVNNRVDATDLRYVSLDDHREFSKKCKPQMGDVLLGKAASVGKVAIVDFIWEFNIWSPIALIRIDRPNVPHFVYYALQGPAAVKQINYFTNSSSQGNVGMGDIEKLELSLPPSDEQQAIATVLSDMDAEIAALEARRDKTRALKQGMMQQLLTGRIRLVAPEVMAERSEAEPKTTKTHGWAFNEAVVISMLVQQFGSERYPLGRMRYTKLSYLLHRHVEKQAEGYLKKAAGPYNPNTKYGGPERIAAENGYVREHQCGPYRGFVAADNMAQAEGYFHKWYGLDCIQWLEQFRRKGNDDLEALATVDMVVEKLRKAGKNVDVVAVKGVTRSYPEWRAKLDRAVFSDADIARAIEACRRLFD